MKEGWEYKKLGEVATIINGKNQKAVENENGEYPICGSGGIMGYATDYLCPEQTVIVGRKGNINRPIFMEQKFWNVDTAFGIIANNLFLLPKFLFYFCVDFNFGSLNKAVTIPSLVKSDLLKIQIFLPSLSEQQHIVEELDLLSSIIEKKKGQLKELDNLAQSIFYEMFGDPITNEKGWEKKKMKDFSVIGTGATPSRIKEEIFYNGNIPWVKTTEVHNCEIYDTEEKITQLAIEQTNCKIYPPNTLLMAMYGQGKTRGQVAKLKISASTNQACAAINLDSQKCDFEYAYACLLLMYENIRAMAQGGNQANLNLKLVSSIQIPLPPLPLQELFASKIQSIEHQKALIKQSITEVETLFNSRMDYYFN
ncbi:MAG: restriction endonuclease subunit S [Prevotella sp.]|nr:restriction endonuclease subunit S [Prevotella sp.]